MSFSLFSAIFFTFSLVILLFKMALKCSVEVLSGVSECKKVVIYLMEKICVGVLATFRQELPSVVSCDFHADESAI